MYLARALVLDLDDRVLSPLRLLVLPRLSADACACRFVSLSAPACHFRVYFRPFIGRGWARPADSSAPSVRYPMSQSQCQYHISGCKDVVSAEGDIQAQRKEKQQQQKYIGLN